MNTLHRVLATAMVAVTAVACSAGDGRTGGSSGPPPQAGPAKATGSATATGSAASSVVGSVPAAAQVIMAKPAYQAARWIYQVSDLKTGQVLLASRPLEMAFTASTAKQFTVGAAYRTLGTDTRLTKPV